MASAAPARPQIAPTHYAGFWIRFVAAFIDGIIVGVANAIISAIFGISRVMPSANADPLANLSIIMASAGKGLIVGAVISFLYAAFLESSEKQATLGKMIVGIKVTDSNLQRISFGQAAARHFSKYISGLILCIGYIMAGFTDKKRALHDMIAGTLVVYNK
jgi:uncharacterized RDD family membrane protein YckC